MTLYATNDDIQKLQAQIARIDKAVSTMAWWLVQAQTGFGQRDARGIQDILDGAPGIHASAEQSQGKP